MKYIIETVLRSSHFILRSSGISIQCENFCFEENIRLYKLSEWFEYNIKNINEFYLWNCLTVKPFDFTKTQEFPFEVKIFCYEENTGHPGG